MSFGTVNYALTDVQCDINKRFSTDHEAKQRMTLIVDCMRYYVMKGDADGFSEYTDSALASYPGYTSAILYSLYSELKVNGIDELHAELVIE
jgi:hypothetical protein